MEKELKKIKGQLILSKKLKKEAGYVKVVFRRCPFQNWKPKKTNFGSNGGQI